MSSRFSHRAPAGVVAAVGLLALLTGCGGDSPAPAEAKEGACVATEAAPDFLPQIGCRKDYDLLSSLPLDTSIPGAVSVKVVLDQRSNDTLYFQNSKKYDIHYKFASANL